MSMQEIKITKDLFKVYSLADAQGIVADYMCISDYNPHMVVEKIDRMSSFANMAQMIMESEIKILLMKAELHVADESEVAKLALLIATIRRYRGEKVD